MLGKSDFTVESGSDVANSTVGTLPFSAVTLTASISEPPLNFSQAEVIPSNALTSGVALDMQPVSDSARAEETRMALILDN